MKVIIKSPQFPNLSDNLKWDTSQNYKYWCPRAIGDLTHGFPLRPVFDEMEKSGETKIDGTINCMNKNCAETFSYIIEKISG